MTCQEAPINLSRDVRPHALERAALGMQMARTEQHKASMAETYTSEVTRSWMLNDGNVCSFFFYIFDAQISLIKSILNVYTYPHTCRYVCVYTRVHTHL